MPATLQATAENGDSAIEGQEQTHAVILKQGKLKLLDPLPKEWEDGRELIVEGSPFARRPLDDQKAFEDWFRKFDALCKAGDEEDDRRRQEALDEAHREAKEHHARKMGLG